MKNILTEKQEDERLSKLKNFNIRLTLEEAERLRSSTWEHKTLIVVDKVKNQILSILDNL